MERITEDNAFFWQCWVGAAAPCNLSHNINGEVALVNGAPIRTHSLTFSDHSEHNRIRSLTEGKDALPFGTEIEILEPLSVNMEICQSLDQKEVSTKRQKQLDQLRKLSISTSDSKIVIPITKSMVSSSAKKCSKFSYPTGDICLPLATAEVQESFPFDLAFAMTVHKAQGRTIEHVVLDLTCQPTAIARMEFAAVFVAMSRVAKQDHIRLLTHLHGQKEFSAKDAYSFITELKPSSHAMACYHGFKPCDGGGLIWDPHRALSYGGI